MTILVQACNLSYVFGGDINAANEAAVSIEIKVLGALRTLGRQWNYRENLF